MVPKSQGPVRLVGKLTVIERTGQRGAFNIGELATSIGDFKIIDSWLEQFDPGIYEGDFWVSQVEPRSNTWKSRVFVEIRATVVDYKIHPPADDEAPRGKSSPEASVMPERDPILDEASAAPVVAPSSRTRRASTNVVAKDQAQKPDQPTSPAATEQPDGGLDAGSDLETLFGLELAGLVKAGNKPVKLDPTVDRELFRQQRDFLKTTGYRFDVKEQNWLPPGQQS